MECFVAARLAQHSWQPSTNMTPSSGPPAPAPPPPLVQRAILCLGRPRASCGVSQLRLLPQTMRSARSSWNDLLDVKAESCCPPYLCRSLSILLRPKRWPRVSPSFSLLLHLLLLLALGGCSSPHPELGVCPPALMPAPAHVHLLRLAFPDRPLPFMARFLYTLPCGYRGLVFSLTLGLLDQKVSSWQKPTLSPLLTVVFPTVLAYDAGGQLPAAQHIFLMKSRTSKTGVLHSSSPEYIFSALPL